MEINNQSVIDQIVEHARAIAALVSKPIDNVPVQNNSELLSIKEITELIFRKMEYTNEDQKTMMNFILSRMKSKGFLAYRFEKGSRMFKATLQSNVSWMIIPEECQSNPDFEFYSSNLHFKTSEISAMLYDLWISNKQSFDKEYLGYKTYVANLRKQ